MAAWRTACPDWEKRLLGRRSLIPKLPLFEEEADRALRVFKRLRVPDLSGTPTYGEVCTDWTFDLVRAVFGAYDPAKRRRLLREFFLLIPKKNGKSSIAAAIMVTAAIVNRRPMAELLLIAPTKKIADIAYKQAAGIIACDPELQKLFHASEHNRTIKHRLSKAELLVKAADADVITGSKATYILIDETHVFSQKASAAAVFVEIRGSLAARPDGFLLQITTQSKDPPAGVFKAELGLARDVRDGKIELPLLPILYELPERVAKDGGWKDPKTWPIVNPNLGRSVDPAFLRDELLKAEREGPEQLALIASQHFNVEVGLALRSDRWRGADLWEDAGDGSIAELEDLIERSEVAVVGLDGGGQDDLFAIGVLGRCRKTRDWLHWGRAWVQDYVLDLRKEIAPALRDFADAGDLVICDAATQHLAEAADIVVQLNAAGLLPLENAVGVDPYAIAQLVDELAKRDVAGDQVRAIGQGVQLSPAVWGIEHKLRNGTFWHGDRPFMAWVIGNARAEAKGNAVLITKQMAGKTKIDPLIALFNAAILMSRNPVGRGRIDDFIAQPVVIG